MIPFTLAVCCLAFVALQCTQKKSPQALSAEEEAIRQADIAWSRSSSAACLRDARRQQSGVYKLTSSPDGKKAAFYRMAELYFPSRVTDGSNSQITGGKSCC
ncbi:MAG TPA: hypothetical protein VNJ07_10060 [Chitinophagales bacterium]|nr:hypothetical protein [Chitinophagales bacterium]